MKLLVVILNYRTPDMTIRAIDAAVRAIAGVRDARIDVVDNDSRDGSFERIAAAVTGRHPASRVRVLQSGHNGGFGAGNNHAMRMALASGDPPELVYIQNSDAFPEPDAVQRLIDFLDANPRAGIAGSALHGVDGAPHTTAFRFPSVMSELESGIGLGVVSKLLWEHRVTIAPRPERTIEVDWLAGASMMIRADVLREIGLFDERFFLYFEETDLCRRAREAGWTTHYVVESRAAHVGGASTHIGKWKRVPDYWLESRALYFRKAHGAAYLQVANAVFAISHALNRVRQRVQGAHSDHTPPYFLRDFVRHSYGVALPVPA